MSPFQLEKVSNALNLPDTPHSFAGRHVCIC